MTTGEDLDFSKYSAVIGLAEARRVSTIDLVSAREVLSSDGRSNQEMEETTESKLHRDAKKHGILYFLSIGYQVFPEGVGVRGASTFADCLAVRSGRTVFVEVLSDTNIKEITLNRKAQLQKVEDLCFLLFVGTKRSNEERLLAAKRSELLNQIISAAKYIGVICECDVVAVTAESLSAHL